MNAFLSKLEPISLPLARIMFGFMFWHHGASKLFVFWGREGELDLLTQRGLAGILEFFGGIAIILGLYTQPIAFLLSGEMAVTFFQMHALRQGSLWPWANRGELPALYCFFFLYLASVGGGKFSIDNMLKKDA